MGHFWDIMISLRGQIVKIGIVIPDPESAIEIEKRFHCDQTLSVLPALKSTVRLNSREVFHVLVPGVTTLKLNLLNLKNLVLCFIAFILLKPKKIRKGTRLEANVYIG